MTNLSKIFCIAATVVFVLGGIGCYNEVERPAPDATQAPDAGPRSGGSQSTLGKARDAAEGTIEDAQRRSQEIADSIEHD